MSGPPTRSARRRSTFTPVAVRYCPLLSVTVRYPRQVREETLYCALGTKFAAPLVCPWELPGCVEPRYPRDNAPAGVGDAAARFALGAWGRLVSASYFHAGELLAGGVSVLALGAIVCCRRAKRAERRGRRWDKEGRLFLI